MGFLKDHNISKSKSKSVQIFETIFDPSWYDNEILPSNLITTFWEAYEDWKKNQPTPKDKDGKDKKPDWNSLNGKMFELIISTLLVKENLLPLYLQANVAFVPNVDYDCLLYTSDNYPISLSIKTSLRERYKQADLEAVVLKYVHRRAKCYLLTLDIEEAENNKDKIEKGEILGLDDIILCNTNSIDKFIPMLKEYSYISPGKVDIIIAKNVVKPKS